MPYGRWPLQNKDAMQPHHHTHLARAACGPILFFGFPTLTEILVQPNSYRTETQVEQVVFCLEVNCLFGGGGP